VAAAAAAAAASPAAGNANGNGNGNANGSVTVGVQQQYAQYLDGPGGAYCLIEQVSSLLLEYPFTYLPPGRAGGRLLSDRAGETRRSVRGTGGGGGGPERAVEIAVERAVGGVVREGPLPHLAGGRRAANLETERRAARKEMGLFMVCHLSPAADLVTFRSALRTDQPAVAMPRPISRDVPSIAPSPHLRRTSIARRRTSIADRGAAAAPTLPRHHCARPRLPRGR
jgi:hypothetical protein